MPTKAKKQKLATFADPTYDTPFKKLFSQETHKDVLVSLLNSLLGFTGNKTIIEASVKAKAIIKEAELEPFRFLHRWNSHYISKKKLRTF